MDQAEKFDLYERSGVREYWIVDPVGFWFRVYRLGSDVRYDKGELREVLGDVTPVSSTVLGGFLVDPVRFFADHSTGNSTSN